MGCCKRPPKMPSKRGVSRAEIAAHAFECSMGGFGAIQGPRRKILSGTDGLTPASEVDWDDVPRSGQFTLLISSSEPSHLEKTDLGHASALLTSFHNRAVSGEPQPSGASWRSFSDCEGQNTCHTIVSVSMLNKLGTAISKSSKTSLMLHCGHEKGRSRCRCRAWEFIDQKRRRTRAQARPAPVKTPAQMVWRR
jgi:hypothetical protein